MSRGKAAVRDIVQFVAFRDFDGKPIESLAAAVLAEVPQQLVAYMRANQVLRVDWVTLTTCHLTDPTIDRPANTGLSSRPRRCSSAVVHSSRTVCIVCT